MEALFNSKLKTQNSKLKGTAMSYLDPHSPDFPFTIGIEEEYQVIDPETRELRSYITQILDRGRMILREQIKPEMHQSIVEVGTNPVRDVHEARAEVVKLRGTIAALASQHGLKIAAAGTHPISSWMHQEITPFERYKGVVDEMQDLALQLLIFGMHVHVGMPNNQVAIELMNVVRYFLPHLLALSTSSPFWMGRSTGFKSYRSAIFSNFPRTGIPHDNAGGCSHHVHVGVVRGREGTGVDGNATHMGRHLLPLHVYSLP